MVTTLWQQSKTYKTPLSTDTLPMVFAVMLCDVFDIPVKQSIMDVPYANQ